MKPKSKTQIMLEDLEAAQETFRRQKFVEETAGKLENLHPDYLRPFLDELKTKANALSYQNKARLQELADSIAADTDVETPAMQETFRRLMAAMATDTAKKIEDIEAAYRMACSRLQSNSQDPAIEAAMGRYMTELSLTGGVGTSYLEVARNAERAIERGDGGAIAFWTRNFDTLARRFEKGFEHRDEMDKISKRLDSEFRARLNPEAKGPAERFAVLREAWTGARMDFELANGSYAADRTAQSIAATGAVAPRARTEDESRIAENKVEIQKRQADLDARLGHNV